MKCLKCNKEFPITAFNRDKTRSTGYFCWCRACKKISDHDSYLKHRDKRCKRNREKYRENPEPILTQNRASWHKHKAKRKIASAEYRRTHKREIQLRAIRYRRTHKELRNAHERKRRAKDIPYRLRVYLRSKLYSVLHGRNKSASALVLIGCTSDELKRHLESKFQPGMSWSNWSPTGWHIDHIIPLASFDLSQPDQLKQAMHYTNLQPLWAEDNMAKGARIP